MSLPSAVKSVVEANDVETIKADWTDADVAIENALEVLRSRSIPLLAIYPADRPEEVIVLRDVVNLIDGIHFDSSEEVHTLGRLYETLLREMAAAGVCDLRKSM